MNVCDAKYGRGVRPYEEEIESRQDHVVLAIVNDERYYRHSKRADYRYWWRLACAEARRRGLRT